MEILTKRLKLRPFNAGDAEDFFYITRDSEIQKYVPYAWAKSIKETKRDIELYYSQGDFKNDFYFLLENKETKDLIGALIATRTLARKFEVALIIGKQFRRQGYMREALEGFIKNMEKGSILVFNVEEENEASIRTIQSLSRLREIRSYKVESTILATTCFFELTV